MKKQIVVIGLGRFGTSLATTLACLGHDVLALDRNEREVQNVASQVTHAVQVDATNEAVLQELGVGNFDIAIVGIGSKIESSVLITILLKKLGVPYIIAKADTELHGSILEKIGADRVVYPECEMGVRVAQGVTLLDVSDYMSLSPGYGVSKLEAPPYFVGKKLNELGFVREGKWEVAVFLIMRGDESIVSPRKNEVIKPDDVLIVAGSHDNLEKLLAEAKKNKEKKAEETSEKK
jgi:trk system potassium uptake protein TrkA